MMQPLSSTFACAGQAKSGWLVCACAFAVMACAEGSGTGYEQFAAAGSSAQGSAGGSSQGRAGSSPLPEPEPGPYTCVPAELAVGENAVAAPAPRISLGRPVVAGDGVTNPGALVDGNYPHNQPAVFAEPSTETPRWVSFNLVDGDLAAGPSRLLVVWKDSGWAQYNDPREGAPLAYHFEVSSDSTDGTGGTWSAAGAAVTDNAVNNRGHAVPFAGQRWLRFVVTSPQLDSAGNPLPVRIDELTVHDASGSPDGLVDDTWVFFGDSITQLAFRRDLTVTASFDAKVAEADAARFPAFVNAGVGGDLAGPPPAGASRPNGLDRLGQALASNPEFKYFALGFGTNDSWGNNDPAAVGFEANMRALITQVQGAGRVPVLARIPFANGKNTTTLVDEHTTVPAFNDVIDLLQAEFELPCGPDLYGLFSADPSGLSADGVHPNPAGYASMNAAWAERVQGLHTSGP